MANILPSAAMPRVGERRLDITAYFYRYYFADDCAHDACH